MTIEISCWWTIHCCYRREVKSLSTCEHNSVTIKLLNYKNVSNTILNKPWFFQYKKGFIQLHHKDKFGHFTNDVEYIKFIYLFVKQKVLSQYCYYVIAACCTLYFWKWNSKCGIAWNWNWYWTSYASYAVPWAHQSTISTRFSDCI